MLKTIINKILNYLKNEWLFFVILAAILFINFYDTGYSVYKPGGIINASNRVTGTNLNKSKGSFNMAYVSMLNGNIPIYLLAKIMPDWTLVKDDKITYNDKETLEDTFKRDELDYKEAISNATYVALTKAGIPFKVTKTSFYVMYITEKNKSKLKVGDQILSYDNNLMQDFNDLKKYCSSKKAGDIINMTYKRSGTEGNTNITLYDEKGVTYAGLSIAKIRAIQSAYNLKLTSKDNESGPSGGLIMTLSIYNALTKKDITKGYKIVGTGTISEDGKVGEIGSVNFKLASAVKAGADIFLCPKENYKDALKYAKKHKYDIIIKEVSSFDDALNYLNQLEVK